MRWPTDYKTMMTGPRTMSTSRFCLVCRWRRRQPSAERDTGFSSGYRGIPLELRQQRWPALGRRFSGVPIPFCTRHMRRRVHHARFSDNGVLQGVPVAYNHECFILHSYLCTCVGVFHMINLFGNPYRTSHKTTSVPADAFQVHDICGNTHLIKTDEKNT